MYAIVDIAGQQFKVSKDQQLYVHRLDQKEGDKVDFDRVLLIDNDGKVNVGAPAIQGAMVKAKVLSHQKGDKVVVFKKKRRKGYKVKNGHRQHFSQIVIEEIIEKGAKPSKAASSKEAKPKAKAAEAPKAKAEATKPATEAKKAAPKKEKAEPKKTEAKAPAAKKTAAKPKAPAKKATPKKETTAKKAAPKKDADNKKDKE